MTLPSITPDFDDYEIPGVGTVRMRPLTSGEVQDFGKAIDEEDEERVLKMLATAIDEPLEDIRQWIDAMPLYQAGRVTEYVVTLSTSGPEVAKALGN